jgi:ribonuclease HI
VTLPLWDDEPADTAPAAPEPPAADPVELVVEADGGSRGNPGIAAGGAVVIADGTVVSEIGVYVGIASNNVAEYQGMIAGLQAAIEREPFASVRVRMDSKLVVEQMSGRWKIKHPDMQVLAAKARALTAERQVTFEWVPRLDNKRADAAANESMDKRESFRRDLDGDGRV